jgi:DNA-binding transcriptional ArsR family regulator
MLIDQQLLDAIASPRRREILRLVWRDERSAGDIHRAMPEVTFGAVSLHLRALTDAGLVEVRPESRHRFYRANRDALAPVARMLETMWDDSLASLKAAAEMEAGRRGPRPSKSNKRR